MATGWRALPRTQLRPYETSAYVDFTGGLDYSRPQDFSDPKFASESYNVRPLPEGGFGSRDAVTFYNRDDFTVEASTLGWWQWADAGYSYVAVGMSDGSFRSIQVDGGYSNADKAAGPGGPFRFIQVNNLPYLLGDGVAALATTTTIGDTPLGTAWNPEAGFSELVPTTGNMPMGRLGEVYHGRMWLADIWEGGVPYHNRVRWSYPLVSGGGEQSWKQAYYNDIDPGQDGQTITGMKASGSSLFVTKQHSTYQITGFTVEDVTFSPVSRSIGAANADAMAELGGALYVWDSVAGLHSITRAPVGGNTPMFDVNIISGQLTPLLQTGTIDQTRNDEVRVGATVGRYGPEVWVVLPWFDGTRRTYVYDVQMKCWFRYGLDLGAFLHIPAAEGWSEFVAIDRAGTRILKLNQVGALDDFGSGPVGFETAFTTARLHGNKPFEPKRHDLLRFVASGTGSLNVEVAKDWDASAVFQSGPAVLSTDAGDPFILDSSELVEAPKEKRLGPTDVETDEPCADVVGDVLVGDSSAGLTVDIRLKHTTAYSLTLTFRGGPGNVWAVHALSLYYHALARTL